MASEVTFGRSDEITVRFFGNFLVSINGVAMNESSSRTKRPWNLLQYLLVNRNKEVNRQQLIEALWPEGNSEQPDKALKNLVYRVRSSFASKGVPFSQDIIQYVNGNYQLNNELHWQLDFERFEQLCEQAAAPDTPRDEAIAAALSAISLYRGDFLAEHVYEDWVLPYNTYYRSHFFRCVEQVLAMLEAEGRYEDIEFVCSRALMIDHFEEQLHLAYMHALIQQDKKSTAVTHYNKLADMFFREMGVTPCAELRELYQDISRSLNNVQTDLFTIKETLGEPEVTNDAFYCDYEVFRSLYRLEARAAERAGQSVFIALLTLNDSAGTLEDPDISNKAMTTLLEVVHSSLRRGDVVSRYSRTQYILMLPTLTAENADMVLKRITDKFSRICTWPGVTIDAKVQPLSPSI